MTESKGELTKLLLSWRHGDDQAFDRLLPLVHGELRRLARRHMAGERPGHTLQTTALVNEAYLRLIDSREVRWQHRAHFYALCSQLMRRVLVDFARSRRAKKRGGDVMRVTFDEGLAVSDGSDIDLVELDDALRALEKHDARKVKVIELRFFGGLQAKETAEVLGVSADTVLRDWKLAKAWLRRELDPTRRRKT